MRLLGFCGPMGCGKSTAIEILKQSTTHSASEVILIKFAAPLYDIQELIYNRISSAYTRPEDFVKDRKLLQWVGTNWGRDTLSITLWADIWKAAVLKAYRENPSAIIVCDDVRFDNECELLKSLGGSLIKIDCNLAGQRNTAAGGIANHSSEAGVDTKFVDYVIENNSSLEDYQDSLYYLYRTAELFKDKTALQHYAVEPT